MKKKIMLLLLMLIPLVTNAKEKLIYDWSYGSDKYLSYIDNENGNIRLAEYNTDNPLFNVKTLDKKGNVKSTISQEQFYNDGGIYNDFMSRIFGYMIEDQYIVTNLFEGWIYICNDTYDGNDCEDLDIDELSVSDQKKYLGDYYMLYKLLKTNSDYYDYYYMFYRGNSAGYYLQYKDLNNACVVEVYDKNEKRIFYEKNDKCYDNIVAASISVDGVYIIKTTTDHKESTASYVLEKYNLENKKEYSEKLNNIITSSSDFTEEDLYYYIVSDINLVDGGLVLNLFANEKSYFMDTCTGRNETELMDPNPGEITRSTPGNQTIISYDDRYNQCNTQYDTYGIPEPITKGATLEPSTTENQTGDNTITTNASKSVNQNTVMPTYLANEQVNVLPMNLIMKLNIEHDISTNIKGKGKVEVIESSGKGEVVTFVITPEKGYVLDSVKVTDSNGNVLILTDNTFTMPNADVVVEAVFLPENPYTADIAIAIIIVLSISLGLLFLRFNKKLTWLK